MIGGKLPDCGVLGSWEREGKDLWGRGEVPTGGHVDMKDGVVPIPRSLAHGFSERYLRVSLENTSIL